jgi:antitoxin component of MazEF toxin-antitoxin module
MKVQVQKWGNSLALRIPKSFAIESNIGQGSTVEVSLENGRIIVFSRCRARVFAGRNVSANYPRKFARRS